MLKDDVGKIAKRILGPRWKSPDIIESRLIIFRYLSLGRTYLPGLILRNSERLLETLAESMDYSVNAPSRIRDRKTMTDELIFISLVSQATSLPDEVTELIMFSRLFNMKAAGIRGTFWIVSTLLNMDAPTPFSKKEIIA